MSELKFHKVECRIVVGHYDDEGELVNEETSQAIQSIYNAGQFGEYLAAAKAEVEARNTEERERLAAEAPNRAARRSRGRSGGKRR